MALEGGTQSEPLVEWLERGRRPSWGGVTHESLLLLC